MQAHADVLRCLRTPVAALCFAVGLASAATAAEVPFAPRVRLADHALGFSSEAAAADLDADGDTDLVSTTRFSTTDCALWLSRNRGGAEMDPPEAVTYGDVWDPTGVAAVDFDSDGLIDLIMTSQSDSKISYYRNLGGGVFDSQVVLSTQSGFAYGIHIADLNQDGRPDLVVPCSKWGAGADNQIHWYENLDGSSVGPRQIVTSLADHPASVAVVDLDRDGDVDILSASYADNEIAWYANNGDETFAVQSIISTAVDGASWVGFGDVDGDGDWDALSCSSGDDLVAWYENLSGPGPGFSGGTQHVIGSDGDGALRLATGDVDADGDLDVVVVSSTDSAIRWYDNQGDGTFAPGSTLISSATVGPRALLLEDLDRDGDLDVVVASYDDGAVDLYENRTIHRRAGFVDSGQSLGGAVDSAVALADLDGDGDIDAFLANGVDPESPGPSEAPNTVLLNDGSGTFVDSGATIGNAYSLDVALGDLDADGDLDAFVANSEAAGNTVWLNNGSGGFVDSGQSLGSGNSSGVALGDLDGDGDLDAFVVNTFSEPDEVWLNDGSGVFADSGQSLGGSWSRSVAVGDVDGDGDLDAVVADSSTNAVWLNDGAGTYSNAGQALGSGVTLDVALGDLDSDGDLDVFLANQDAPNTVWWNDGSGVLTVSGQSLGSSRTYAVTLIDVDADGDLDAYCANGVTSATDRLWLNDGAGTLTDSGQGLESANSVDVALADLDGDGDLDAFVGEQESSNAVWRNDGGQVTFGTTDSAPFEIISGARDDVLTIELTHNGRIGDSAVELATVELLLEEATSDPLTTAEANALIERLLVVRDDGDGAFTVADTEVAVVGSLALTAGVQTVVIADDQEAARVGPASTGVFFVVLELTADADSQSVTTVVVTHQVASSSTAEDATADLPVTAEPAVDVASSQVAAAPRVCDHEWMEAVSGDWNVAGNWVGGVPVVAASVCITIEGSYTVDVSSATAAVGSLEVDGGSGTVNLHIGSGGTLSSDGPVSIAMGDVLTLNGGAVAGTGSLSVIGSVEVLQTSSVAMDVASSGSISLWAPLTVSGSLTSGGGVLLESETLTSTVDLDVAGDLTNTGTITLTEVPARDGSSRQAETRIDVGGVIANQTVGTIVITSDGGATAVRRILSGDLHNHGAVQVDYPFQLQGSGRAHVNNGTISVAGDTEINLFTGSTFTNNGTIELLDEQLWTGDGTFDVGTGTITGTGLLTLVRTTVTGGTLAVASGWPVELLDSTVDSSAAVANNGEIVVGGTTTISGQYTSGVGSVLTIDRWTGSSTLSTAGFTNHGLIELTNSATATAYDMSLVIASGRLTNANDGTLRSLPGASGAGGARTVIGGFDNFGVIDVQHPLTMITNGAETTNQAGGLIDVNSGDLTLDLLYDRAPSSFTNLGTLEISAGRTMQLFSGTFEPASGTVNNNGVLDLDQTNIGVGSLTVASGAQLEIESATIEAVLVNRGTVLIEGVSVLTTLLDNDGGVLRVGSEGSGAVLGTVGFTNDGIIELGSGTAAQTSMQLTTGVLDNSATGVIRGVDVGTGDRIIAGPVSNTGLVEALEADLSFDLSSGGRAPASFTNLGTIDIGSGRSVSLSGALARDASSFTQSGMIEVAVGGTLTFDTGSFAATSGSSISLDGALEFIGVTGEFQTGASVAASSSSSVAVRGGGSGGASVTFADGLITAGGLELGNDDPGALPRDVIVTFGGAGMVQSEGGVCQSAPGSGGGARTIVGEVDAAGVMQVEHPLLITGADAEHSVSGTLEIAGGDLTVDLTGSRAPSSFTNSGTIEIGSGRSLMALGSLGRAPSSFTNLGTIDLGSSSTLSLSAGTFTNSVGGVVGGVGTVDVSSASFANDGVIRPGQSAGTLHVLGSITSSPTSVLEIEVGEVPVVGTFDRLEISGSLALDGIVRARLLAAEPAMGELFSVVSAGSLSGDPAWIDQPTTVTGRGFAARVGATLDLEVVCATGPRLRLDAWSDPAPVTVDHELRLVAEVANAGGVTALAPELTASLPASLTYEGCEPPGVCGAAGPDVSCDLSALPAGGRSQVTIVTTPTVVGPATAYLSVATSQTCEVDLSDNGAAAELEVVDDGPCDANGDGEINAADVPVAAECAFGHSAAGNPNCSETGGVDAADLILIIDLATP